MPQSGIQAPLQKGHIHKREWKQIFKETYLRILIFCLSFLHQDFGTYSGEKEKLRKLNSDAVAP